MPIEILTSTFYTQYMEIVLQFRLQFANFFLGGHQIHFVLGNCYWGFHFFLSSNHGKAHIFLFFWFAYLWAKIISFTYLSTPGYGCSINTICCASVLLTDTKSAAILSFGLHHWQESIPPYTIIKPSVDRPPPHYSLFHSHFSTAHKWRLSSLYS